MGPSESRRKAFLFFSLPVPTPLKKPPSRAINQSVEDFLDDLFGILNFNSCAVLAMTILRFSVLCPLVLFMHSENLDFFYRGKEHRRFLSTVWLQQVSCTLSTVSPLKRQYARPQHCTFVLLWSSALPFAMDLEKSSRVVQLLPLHIVLIFFCQLPSQSFMKKKAVNLCAVTYFLRGGDVSFCTDNNNNLPW